MNADIAREKYVKLMTEVEDLEDQVAALDAKPKTPKRLKDLEALQLKLAERRTELTRISDGCGTPHAR